MLEPLRRKKNTDFTEDTLVSAVVREQPQILIQNLTSYQARTKNLSLESSSQLNEAETRQPMLLSSWEKNKIKG